MVLNILVIHGYVQTAATVANNTAILKDVLSDIANLHYVDGPPMKNAPYSFSRPWWILGSTSEDPTMERWHETVKWWSEELSNTQYDGIIGLSQGAAMAALLVSMLKTPGMIKGFHPAKVQPIKFAILCSGFISGYRSHKQIYVTSEELPTLHTVDMHDIIVPSQKTIELQTLFKNSKLLTHNEGHSIPIRGNWPKIIREFIIDACPSSISVNRLPAIQHTP